MQKFTQHTGIVAPLDRPNVDTDAIIPKQFLKSIKRSGFGPNAFDDWRYLDEGGPDIDNGDRNRLVLTRLDPLKIVKALQPDDFDEGWILQANAHQNCKGKKTDLGENPPPLIFVELNRRKR